MGPWQGLVSRGFVVLHGLPDELSPGVDCEDSRFWEAHLTIGGDILWETGRGWWAGGRKRCFSPREEDTHIGPVPKGSIEGLSLGQEQLLDVAQAGNLEHLWLLLNHLPGEPGPQAGKTAEEG